LNGETLNGVTGVESRGKRTKGKKLWPQPRNRGGKKNFLSLQANLQRGPKKKKKLHKRIKKLGKAKEEKEPCKVKKGGTEKKKGEKQVGEKSKRTIQAKKKK